MSNTENGKTFWKDFKKFIKRGNVMDMAVGVVIGASFGKIITALVNDILNPFIGLFMKSGSLDSIKTVIKPAVLDEAGEIVTAEVAILWGSWFQTILDFLITALCVFVVVRLVTEVKNTLEEDKIAAEKAKAEEARIKAEAAAAEEKLRLEAEARKEEAFKESIVNQEKLLTAIYETLKERKGE